MHFLDEMNELLNLALSWKGHLDEQVVRVRSDMTVLRRKLSNPVNRKRSHITLVKSVQVTDLVWNM